MKVWDKNIEYTKGDVVTLTNGDKVIVSDKRPRIKFYNDGVHVEKTKHTCIQSFYEFAFHQWYLSGSPT